LLGQASERTCPISRVLLIRLFGHRQPGQRQTELGSLSISPAS
jgi:hypothetical protein